MTIIRSRSEL